MKKRRMPLVAATKTIETSVRPLALDACSVKPEDRIRRSIFSKRFAVGTRTRLGTCPVRASRGEKSLSVESTSVLY